jgi:hypothetical protein
MDACSCNPNYIQIPWLNGRVFYILLGGACVQSHANSFYINLGSFHHKMKMKAVKIRGAFRKEYVWLPWLIGRASIFYHGGRVFIPRQIHCI